EEGSRMGYSYPYGTLLGVGDRLSPHLAATIGCTPTATSSLWSRSFGCTRQRSRSTQTIGLRAVRRPVRAARTRGDSRMGSVVKKRRKRMAKKKHRKLLRKTRVQRRRLGK